MSIHGESNYFVERRNRERQFRTLLDSAPDATLVVDRKGAIVATNTLADTLFGYACDELVGRSLEVLLPERYRAAHQRHRQSFSEAARVRGMGSGLSLSACRKDGSEFPIEVSLNPVAAEEGLWIVAAVRDISDRLRREELEQQNGHIVESNRLKTMFLANMSHELRTPLNAVIGFAELLYDEHAGAINPRQKDFLRDILGGAEHLLSLINGMLDLARIEAGKMDFQPTTFAVDKLMVDVRDTMRVLAAQKELTLTVEVDPALGSVTLDPLKLKQVLLNFAANAIKFTPERGHVALRARREGEHAFRVEVADTGPGIPASQIQRLFVEFQQLDFGLGRREGTGLGLALSKRIVEAQGGHVGVSSVEGQGSVFFAVLPREVRELPPSQTHPS
jgi:protein-histidine pros-kinase